LSTRAGDAARAVGLSYNFPVLLNSVAKELYQKEYKDLDDEEQPIVKAANKEERFLTYVML
jgi:hypothetical protein